MLTTHDSTDFLHRAQELQPLFRYAHGHDAE
jgi:hypothetical protein